MKKFPVHMKPEYEDKFASHLLKLRINHLREKIYFSILSKEKQGFDLVRYLQDYDAEHNTKTEYQFFMDHIVSKIISELNIFCWKTELAYGNTSLFIYSSSSAKPIINCLNIGD